MSPATICQSFPILRTTDKERVARKYGLARVVFHEETDAILRVARRMNALDQNIAELERLLVRGRLGHALAVLAPDNL